MWQTRKLLLRRRHHSERGNSGYLSRHHIHDNRGRVHRTPAWHIQTHAVHGNEALGHRAAIRNFSHNVRAALVFVHQANPADRFFKTGSDGGVKLL